MTKKPYILIVNDDGIHAPGIRHLWNALVDKADVAIIAPAYEQSAVGLGITLRKPLHVEEVSWEKQTPAWKVTGTPADCVRMAVSVILDRTPDLIVSGINRGSNAGRVVLYSGTIAGIIEGVYRNIPGVAFSHTNYETPDYASAEKHIFPIVSYLLANPLPQGTLLNVNFPEGEVKGYKFARQGKSYYIEDPSKRLHPEGYSYYWQSGKWSDHEEEDESDTALLKAGYLTAVPIHVDQLTDHDHLLKEKSAFEQLNFPSFPI